MTRMIPLTMNPSMESSAERRMFQIIRDAPDSDDWVCFHSFGLAHHPTKRHGEADFVLLARHGVFTLEVKGGRISHSDGVWYSIDRYDQRHKLKESPFKQAIESMHALEKCIKRNFVGQKQSRALFGFGVVFPDFELTQESPEWDRRVVYDSLDRQKPFTSYINRLAQFHRSVGGAKKRPSLTPDTIEELAEYLRADFDAIPSATLIIGGIRDELNQLTLEQRDVLADLDSQKRVIVRGGAGTGKTVLAVDAATRLAEAGNRVLFLCFNRLHATRLSNHFGAKGRTGQIIATNVDDHFVKVTHGTEFETEVLEAIDHDKPTAFAKRVPECAALIASERKADRFDALVLDEAQDFLTSIKLDALHEMVHGGIENGCWYVFLDAEHQAGVYRNFESHALARLEKCGMQRSLWRNCRNTSPIALQTAFVCGGTTPVRARIDGPPVDFRTYRQPGEWLRNLEHIISNLRADEVLPGSISVLFLRTPEDYIPRLTKMGLRRLTEADIPKLGTSALEEITWGTVSGFKGLENDVIVLVGVENLEDDWYRSLAYVGMTRARSRLHVIIHEDCDKKRKEREREWKARQDSDVEMLW